MASLKDSSNEWCARLIHVLNPMITQGFRSIFKEANQLCVENDEEEKYLMTFQNFLTRVPKWNASIIDIETKRIINSSKCGYLEDLITCVHIIQLKSLTCMRVGNNHKKIDINIPQLNDFIHKVYINAARKIYSNVYLFEQRKHNLTHIMPLDIQKNNRELEVIINECIMCTIRDNIPVEEILKVYMDESIEEYVQVEEKEEIISEEPIYDEPMDNEQMDDENVNNELVTNISTDQPAIKFSDIDNTIDIHKTESKQMVPKTIENLEIISNENHQRRKSEEEEEYTDKLNIGNNIDLSELDVHSILTPAQQLKNEDVWDEIEILPLE